MDITEFMEQDILIFLDDRLDMKAETQNKPDVTTETVFLTKDYEKELLAALDAGNIVAAKQTLSSLKEELDVCPPGPDKEHLKALLLALYEKFKDYIDAHHLTITDPSLGLRTDASIAQPAAPQEAGQQAAAAKPAAPQELVERLRAEAEAAVKRGDLTTAMGKYQEARKAFISLPDAPHDLGLQLVSLFGSIKQLTVEQRIKALATGKESQAPGTAPSAPASAAGSNLDTHLMLQLEQEKQAMDRELQSGDLAAAAKRYRTMRMIIQQVKDPILAKQAGEKLKRIYDIIAAMRTHSGNNEQQLAKVLP